MIEPMTFPLINRQFLPACVCRIALYDEEQETLHKREKNERIELLFKKTGLGVLFRECTLENWKQRPGTEKAYEAARRYRDELVNNIHAGRGLLLFGKTGNGKSHLLAALVNEALKLGYGAVFERVPKLLSQIRDTYKGRDVTERQIMDALTAADLVVLDDAGAEKWTEWTEPTLYTIIDERYTNRKALLVTTNSSLEELEQKIGTRAMDRVLGMCEIVENKGTSYRKEQAKRRMAEGKKG